MPQTIPRAASAPTVQPGPGGALPDSLAELRSRIDATDERILALVMERQALSARAAASKAPGDMLKIRPDREQQVISRLQGLGEGVGEGLIERLWRELLSDGLARQSPFQLAMWAADAPVKVAEAARRRFGCGPPLDAADTPEDALARAAASCDVAVLELGDSNWWLHSAERWPQVQVFAVLADAQGRVCALALARVEPGAIETGPKVVIAAADPQPAGAVILARKGSSLLCLTADTPDHRSHVIGAACGWTGEQPQ